jgi:hypothetical protein
VKSKIKVTGSLRITNEQLGTLKAALRPLIVVQFHVLQLPAAVLAGFEPSQVGTLVGVLMDACIPQLDQILDPGTFQSVGLKKHAGILKDREGYPDFLHESGFRLELKLLYVEPTALVMKKPSTPREPSARLTQKVTVKNVVPATDALLIIAYQLQPTPGNPAVFAPTITDIGVFSMIECIEARDNRLTAKGGKWFGNFETPAVLSKIGRRKYASGKPLKVSGYGRKESEGFDYNEDTNFGKLARVPYQPLNNFLRNHGWRAPATTSEDIDNLT